MKTWETFNMLCRNLATKKEMSLIPAFSPEGEKEYGA